MVNRRNFIFWFLVPLLLVTHLLLLINLSFTPWPEMLSFPYLFSKGFVFYKDMVLVYPPLLIILLSLVYKIFGYSVITLKVFSWFLIIFSDVLVYTIVKKITGKNIAALLSLGLYVFLQPFLEGNMLWFDTFLVVPVLLVIYFLIGKNISSKSLILSGTFLAISLFSKQSAIFYVLFLGIFVIFFIRSIKKTFLFLTPLLIMGILFLVYLTSTGSLTDFFNWNFIFPMKYWGDYPSYVQFDLKKVDYLVLFTLILPLVVLIFNKGNLLLKLAFIGSLLAVYPRFSYYHLAVAISLSAIIFGVVYSKYEKLVYPKILTIVLLLLILVFNHRAVIKWDWQKEDRFKFDNNLKIQNEEVVYFMNLDSSNYVYTNTVPPKPWYDYYGWYLEIPNQQEKIINAWSKSPPEEIFWKKEDVGEWYKPGVYKPKLISKWVEENYEKKGEIEDNIFYWTKK